MFLLVQYTHCFQHHITMYWEAKKKRYQINSFHLVLVSPVYLSSLPVLMNFDSFSFKVCLQWILMCRFSQKIILKPRNPCLLSDRIRLGDLLSGKLCSLSSCLTFKILGTNFYYCADLTHILPDPSVACICFTNDILNGNYEYN